MNRAIAVGLGWALVAAIVVLSLAPMPDTGPDLPHQDKWGHLLAYGALMGWFTRLYPRAPTAWWYFLGFALLGLALEWLQSLLPYREGDPMDLWANLLGLALGLIIARALKRGSGSLFQQ